MVEDYEDVVVGHKYVAEDCEGVIVITEIWL